MLRERIRKRQHVASAERHVRSALQLRRAMVSPSGCDDCAKPAAIDERISRPPPKLPPRSRRFSAEPVVARTDFIAATPVNAIQTDATQVQHRMGIAELSRTLVVHSPLRFPRLRRRSPSSELGCCRRLMRDRRRRPRRSEDRRTPWYAGTGPARVRLRLVTKRRVILRQSVPPERR